MCLLLLVHSRFFYHLMLYRKSCRNVKILCCCVGNEYQSRVHTCPYGVILLTAKCSPLVVTQLLTYLLWYMMFTRNFPLLLMYSGMIQLHCVDNYSPIQETRRIGICDCICMPAVWCLRTSHRLSVSVHFQKNADKIF